ncbi:unnamed protein product [Rhizoctonia solani]|uniref:Uncharacterized protein n=1 Tax=Rhizoctonia solani TaxID=456999 RepID=A0A8H2WM62_9AGAM|nr:unnamed protein product [Rhizoctonia solani]
MPNLTSRTNWSSDPLDSTIITDTRLLAFWFGEDGANVTQKLPPNVYTYNYISTSSNSSRYYAFAWVTFSAGVGRCMDHQCVVSSSSTIQNTTPINLEPHPLTFQALSMAPVIAISLVYHNISIPSSWKDANNYIEAVLVRSYSGAWNIPNKLASVSNTNSNYRPALPSLVANVNHTRVYAWLGIQLSVTLLSIIFLLLQFNLSEIPLIGDTTLAAFYLDTTGLPESTRPLPFVDGTLKVQEEGDRLKIKVEQTEIGFGFSLSI